MEEPVEKPDSTQEPDVWAVAPENTHAQDEMQQGQETPVLIGETKQQPKGKGKRIALIILGLIFVAGVTYGTYYVLHAMQLKNNGTSSVKTGTVKSETAQKAPATSTTTAIDTSLDSIDSGMTQATTDQTDASDAVSDSDKQITVPTE